jgi:hypothetical protein
VLHITPLSSTKYQICARTYNSGVFRSIKARGILVEGNFENRWYLGFKWKKDLRKALKSLVSGAKFPN